MSKKVIKGQDTHSLCHSCRHCFRIKNDLGSTLMVCDRFERTMRINRPVHECTEYSDASLTSLWKMEKIAWLLDPSRRAIGFIRPGTDEHKKLREDHD